MRLGLFYIKRQKFYWRNCKVLRETNYIETYPNRTVIEDMIVRDGPATEDSFTPFKGVREAFDAQFRGEWSGRFKMREFLKSQTSDFEPNVKLHGDIYTLEQCFINGVESPLVEEFIMNVATGYKINNTSPARKNKDYQTYTVKYFGGDDDDEEKEEKYLQIRNDDMLSNQDYEELIREIPYILRTIWSYSKKYQAHLISFALAYKDVITCKQRAIKIHDFADYTTYRMTKTGVIDKTFNHSADNKYTIYPAATKIFIYPGDHKAEFEVCMKYLRALDMLGIDYRDENPKDYTNEFMEKLVCTYLPTNNEYFVEYGDIDTEIIAALKPENIFATRKSHIYQNIVQPTKKEFDYSRTVYMISERLLMAYQMNERNREMFSDKSEDTLLLLDEILSIKAGQQVTAPRNTIEFMSDGFMYFNRVPFFIDGELFGLYNGRTDYNVGFTKYGLLVIVEEDYSEVYYMTLNNARLSIEEFKYNGKVEKTYWKNL